jgi:hypothetical protein
MRKAVCSWLALAAVIGFFVSRQAVTEAGKDGKYAEMIRELHNKPASKKLVEEFVKDGTPALDAVLADFANSDFAKKTRAKLDKNFNLGKAIDDSVYATNVIKVAQAFGSAGFDRLLKRTLDKKQQEDFMSVWSKQKEAKSLEKELMRPLLIAEITRGMKSDEEKARRLRWIDRYVDVAKLNSGQGTKINHFLWKALLAVAVEVAVEGAVELALCHFAHPLIPDQAGITNPLPDIMRPEHRGELLAASVRARLKPLDPRK